MAKAEHEDHIEIAVTADELIVPKDAYEAVKDLIPLKDFSLTEPLKLAEGGFIPKPEDEAPEEPAIVDPEPVKRLVPVVVNGVFHGMREE